MAGADARIGAIVLEAFIEVDSGSCDDVISLDVALNVLVASETAVGELTVAVVHTTVIVSDALLVACFNCLIGIKLAIYAALFEILSKTSGWAVTVGASELALLSKDASFGGATDSGTADWSASAADETIDTTKDGAGHAHEWDRHEERQYFNGNTEDDAEPVGGRGDDNETSKLRGAIEDAKHWVEE